MGYHVLIIRKLNGLTHQIQKQEVEKLVELTPDARIESPSLNSAVLDLIVMQNGIDACWLTLQNGVLWSKDPEPNEIQIMVALASELGARVRGDNFETYRSADDTYFDAEDAEDRVKSELEGQRILNSSKTEDLKIKIAIVIIFSLVGAFAYFVGSLFEK